MTRTDKALKIASYMSNKPKHNFTTYNGLMPIIEAINYSGAKGGIDITYNVLVTVNWQNCQFYITKDYKLIDALQDAILFYFENHNDINEFLINNGW